MAPPSSLALRLARQLELPEAGVAATLALLEEGNTVPFIARYRKERTGGLDEVQIRSLEEQSAYHTELDKRRETVLESIREQGKLTPSLEERIRACLSKTEMEDLYLPYRPKRKTRASVARERGLEPLAGRIARQPLDGRPEEDARGFVDPKNDVADVEAALAGARDIVAERIAEHAPVRATVRDAYARHGVLTCKVKKGHEGERTKFESWYDYRDPLTRVPSHRFLAIQRGEAEGILKLSLEIEEDRVVDQLLGQLRYERRSAYGKQLAMAAADAFKRLLRPVIRGERLKEAKQKADSTAVGVFAKNLSALLLAPPLGEQAVLGVDPGIRTGCKCAAVDVTGRFLGHDTIFPSGGASPSLREQAAPRLVKLVQRFRPQAIAVGNGTAGRETESFTRDTLKGAGLDAIPVVLVNEAGASVYSASDIAREEFPDLDLTVRGAISIARRLQDPLAELVRVEPKAIGVGQYQHDVDQKMLNHKLDEVVESCVNRVGVELNTASAPLLARVAGLGPKSAERIVAHRNQNGVFRSRRALMKVKGLGARTFEQAAGFLRVQGSKHPLDASAVHPERYALVERMARDLDVGLSELVGNAELARRLELSRYVDDEVGEPTLRDILTELAKPGRDPRDQFEAARFRDDVRKPQDLEEGMVLEGVVTNVTAFGAFVDIGVHRDGLVHISHLADRFVRDPNEVVCPGDRLRVRVLEVDLKRERISLSAKDMKGHAGQ